MQRFIAASCILLLTVVLLGPASGWACPACDCCVAMRTPRAQTPAPTSCCDAKQPNRTSVDTPGFSSAPHSARVCACNHNTNLPPTVAPAQSLVETAPVVAMVFDVVEASQGLPSVSATSGTESPPPPAAYRLHCSIRC